MNGYVDNVTDMPGMPPIPAKEAIPSEYSSGTKLEAEVKAGGNNEFNFTIAAAPGK